MRSVSSWSASSSGSHGSSGLPLDALMESTLASLNSFALGAPRTGMIGVNRIRTIMYSTVPYRLRKLLFTDIAARSFK